MRPPPGPGGGSFPEAANGSFGHSSFIPGQAAAVPAPGAPGAPGVTGGGAEGSAGGGASTSLGEGKGVALPGGRASFDTSVIGPPPRSTTRMPTSSIRASPMPVSAKVTESGSGSGGTIR